MSVATVIAITGQAWARDADGNLRELRVGDTLQEGEVLVTSDNGSVQLDFGDGLDPTLIPGGESVAMVPELDEAASADESEFAAMDEDVEALLSALEDEDIDLLEVLEATAAGAGPGGGADGGHGFVRLARISEDVEAPVFTFAGADTAEPDIEDTIAPAVAELEEDADTEPTPEPEPQPDPEPEPEQVPPTLEVTAGEPLVEGEASAGDTVATSEGDDPDGDNGALVYSLTPGSNDAGYYAIDAATGTVTLTGAGADHVNAGNDLPVVDVTVTDEQGLTASSTATISVVDGAGPTPGDSDGEGATLSLTLADAATEDGATDTTDGQLRFTAGSDDITGFAFGDTTNLTVTGLDGTLSWATDTDGNLIGSLDGDAVLKLSLADTGPIAAGESGSVTMTAELLGALPHDVDVDELSLNGLEVIASEADGDSATGTVDVKVNDDLPTFDETGIDDASLSAAAGSDVTGDLNLEIGADLEGAQIANATLKEDGDGFIQVEYQKGGDTHTAFLTSGGSKLQYEFDQASQQLVAFKQGDTSNNPVFTIDFDIGNDSYKINVIEELDPVTVGFENAGVTSNGGGTGLALGLDGADLNAVFTMQDGGNVNWSNTGIGGSPNNLIGNGDVLVANFDQVLTELSFSASRGVGNPQTAEWEVYRDGQKVGDGTGNSIEGIDGGFDEVHFIGHGGANDQYRVNDFSGRYQDSSINYRLPVDVVAVDGDGDNADSNFTIGFDPVPSSIDLPEPEEPAAPSITGGEVFIDEAWLSDGTREGRGDITQEGRFELDAEGGIVSLTVGGHSLDVTTLQDLEQNPVAIPIDGIGTLILTGFQGTVTGGTLSYELTLDGSVGHDDLQGRNDEALDIELALVDFNGESDSGTLAIVVQDDVPESDSDTVDLDVVIDEFGIEDIDGNWVNAAGGSSSAANHLVSNGIGIIWGGNNFDEASGYKFEYASEVDAENSIVSGDPLSLGTFTHVNNPIPAGNAIDEVSLSLKVAVMLNGELFSIPVDVVLEHDETPNSGEPSDSGNDDFITIKDFTVDQGVINQLAAAGYQFSISGFKDSDGNLVETVRTTETASTSYELFATVEYVGEPVTAEGSISAAWGADGPAENDPIVVEHANGNSAGLDASGQVVIEGQYGTLTLNDEGHGEFSYSYVLSQAGRQALKADGNLTENFSYTVKDGDGDKATSSLGINIDGKLAPTQPDPEAPALTSIIASVSGHTVGNSNSGIMATAQSLKAANHNSAAATETDGYYAVDHRGNDDDPEAIEFREALLLELGQPAEGMTLAYQGEINGATYHLYGTDGIRFTQGNVEDVVDADGNLAIQSSNGESIAHMAFLGGSTGNGNSGDSSTLSVKPLALTIVGDSGENALEATRGDDTLFGGAGDDSLTGGLGADTFAWEFGDEGPVNEPAEDVVKDFTVVSDTDDGQFGDTGEPNADRLDLADLLQDEENNAINDYILAEEESGNVVLHISSDGSLAGDKDNADQTIILEDKSFSDFGINDPSESADLIQKMLDSGQLNIDQ